jgi:hypothetical protein
MWGKMMSSDTCHACKWEGSRSVCAQCHILLGRIKAGRESETKPVQRDRQGGESVLKRKNEGKAQVPKGPNKTEAEYGRILAAEFPGCEIRFEGLIIRMLNGHKYTPDWVVWNKRSGPVLCAEVKARGKNGFRFASYGRAKLAFDQVRIEWPNMAWRWAEKSKGMWNIERKAKGVIPISEALTWQQILAEKFPAFDPNWPGEVQAKWFEGFNKLMDQFKKPEGGE